MPTLHRREDHATETVWVQRMRYRLLLLLLGLGALWLLEAIFFGPVIADVVARAVRGDSLPVLQGLLAHFAPQALERYPRVLTTVNGTMVGLWAGVMVVLWGVTAPQFFRRYVGESTPESLGAIRILTCTILLAMTLWEDLGDTAILPPEMIRRFGVLKLFHLLPGFADFLRHATALRVFQGMTVGLLGLGVLGLGTRLVMPAAALCSLLLGGIIRQYGFFFHAGLLPIYVLLVLSCTPCGDGWSLDRILRLRHDRLSLRSGIVYGWARYACWLVILIPYCMAGLSKLATSGMMWWHATNMRAMWYTCTLQPLNFNWQVSLALHPLPDLFFAVPALFVLMVELGAILGLFSGLARRLFAVLMMLSQIGIIFLQNILFVDLFILTVLFADDRICQRLAALLSRWRWRREPALRPLTVEVAQTASRWTALRIAAFICMLWASWVLRIEFYPLTAMQMFAWQETGVVTYYKVLAHDESGEVRYLSLTDVLGSEADFRYRYHLEAAFNPRRTHITTRYLTVVGEVLNQRAAPGNRAKQIEVQKWQWDFRQQPQSPTYGEVVDRFVVDLQSSTAARK